MKLCQGPPSLDKGVEVGREGDPGQLLRQVVGKALPITRRMQDPVDVIEEVVLGDRVVLVVSTEGAQGGI